MNTIKPKLKLKLTLTIFVLFLSLPVAPCYSLDFSEAARLAAEVSDELRNEARRIQLREGAWKWGLRSYLPRFSISAAEDDRLSTINSDSFIKNYAINMDQLIWDGGRISMSRKLEKAELNMAGLNLQIMAGRISDAAVSAYRSVLYNRMALDIREKSYSYLENQRAILLRELELGLILAIDLASADISIAQAGIEIKSLKLDLNEAEQQLAEALGLDTLPELTEKIDIYRSIRLPDPALVRSAAESGNPDLIAARYMIQRRQAEAKYASISWLPTIKLTGSVGLSGQHYPLTKLNYSLGLTFEFVSPWVSVNLGGSAGKEGRHDNNARVSGSASPLPDPASAFSARNAALNLEQEITNYAAALKLSGRMAEQAVEKCRLLEEKRILAVETFSLETERYRLAELRLELGRITRLELMDAMLALAESEISAVRAAVLRLEAERELEKFLNISPGELAFFGVR